MKTETLPFVEPPGKPRSKKRRSGWVLRIVMAVAIIATASWYLWPQLSDLSTGDDPLTATLVTTDDVNLRAGPGTSYDVISVIPVGTEVAANTNPEGGFLQVGYEGNRGWISATYLSSPNRVIAQSQTVSAAESEPEPEIVETVAEPEPTRRVVQQPPEPEPTSVPAYEPTVAQSTEMAGAPQPGEKWIDVNRTTRTVTLYNGEIVVAEFDSLIGKDLSADGYYSTALGTFYVHVKEKSLAETPFAEGVYLTDFVGFDPHRSNGFHSPVRDEFGDVVVTGGTSTLGCVRLSEDDAIFLFNFAYVGMRVEVHD